jgi:hypothetical protein
MPKSSARYRKEWLAVECARDENSSLVPYLDIRSYPVVLPCYSEEHRWCDRRKKVRKALCAGYAFSSVSGHVLDKPATIAGVRLSDAERASGRDRSHQCAVDAQAEHSTVAVSATRANRARIVA